MEIKSHHVTRFGQLPESDSDNASNITIMTLNMKQDSSDVDIQNEALSWIGQYEAAIIKFMETLFHNSLYGKLTSNLDNGQPSSGSYQRRVLQQKLNELKDIVSKFQPEDSNRSRPILSNLDFMRNQPLNFNDDFDALQTITQFFSTSQGDEYKRLSITSRLQQIAEFVEKLKQMLVNIMRKSRSRLAEPGSNSNTTVKAKSEVIPILTKQIGSTSATDSQKIPNWLPAFEVSIIQFMEILFHNTLYSNLSSKTEFGKAAKSSPTFQRQKLGQKLDEMGEVMTKLASHEFYKCERIMTDLVFMKNQSLDFGDKEEALQIITLFFSTTQTTEYQSLKFDDRILKLTEFVRKLKNLLVFILTTSGIPQLTVSTNTSNIENLGRFEPQQLFRNPIADGSCRSSHRNQQFGEDQQNQYLPNQQNQDYRNQQFGNTQQQGQEFQIYQQGPNQESRNPQQGQNQFGENYDGQGQQFNAEGMPQLPMNSEYVLVKKMYIMPPACEQPEQYIPQDSKCRPKWNSCTKKPPAAPKAKCEKKRPLMVIGHATRPVPSITRFDNIRELKIPGQRIFDSDGQCVLKQDRCMNPCSKPVPKPTKCKKKKRTCSTFKKALADASRSCRRVCPPVRDSFCSTEPTCINVVPRRARDVGCSTAAICQQPPANRCQGMALRPPERNRCANTCSIPQQTTCQPPRYTILPSSYCTQTEYPMPYRAAPLTGSRNPTCETQTMGPKKNCCCQTEEDLYPKSLSCQTESYESESRSGFPQVCLPRKPKQVQCPIPVPKCPPPPVQRMECTPKCPPKCPPKPCHHHHSHKPVCVPCQPVKCPELERPPSPQTVVPEPEPEPEPPKIESPPPSPQPVPEPEPPKILTPPPSPQPVPEPKIPTPPPSPVVIPPTPPVPPQPEQPTFEVDVVSQIEPKPVKIPPIEPPPIEIPPPVIEEPEVEEPVEDEKDPSPTPVEEVPEIPAPEIPPAPPEPEPRRVSAPPEPRKVSAPPEPRRVSVPPEPRRVSVPPEPPLDPPNPPICVPNPKCSLSPKPSRLCLLPPRCADKPKKCTAYPDPGPQCQLKRLLRQKEQCGLPAPTLCNNPCPQTQCLLPPPPITCRRVTRHKKCQFPPPNMCFQQNPNAPCPFPPLNMGQNQMIIPYNLPPQGLDLNMPPGILTAQPYRPQMSFGNQNPQMSFGNQNPQNADVNQCHQHFQQMKVLEEQKEQLHAKHLQQQAILQQQQSFQEEKLVQQLELLRKQQIHEVCELKFPQGSKTEGFQQQLLAPGGFQQQEASFEPIGQPFQTQLGQIFQTGLGIPSAFNPQQQQMSSQQYAQQQGFIQQQQFPYDQNAYQQLPPNTAQMNSFGPDPYLGMDECKQPRKDLCRRNLCDNPKPPMANGCAQQQQQPPYQPVQLFFNPRTMTLYANTNNPGPAQPAPQEQCPLAPPRYRAPEKCCPPKRKYPRKGRCRP